MKKLNKKFSIFIKKKNLSKIRLFVNLMIELKEFSLLRMDNLKYFLKNIIKYNLNKIMF